MTKTKLVCAADILAIRSYVASRFLPGSAGPAGRNLRGELYTDIFKTLSKRGWDPHVELIGDLPPRAVLWCGHFIFGSIIIKMALHREGRRLYHISRKEHGFSESWFGTYFLNRFRVEAENTFLAGRLLVDRNQPGKVLREAAEVLKKENALVSITAGAWEGKHKETVNGITLATGALRLAKEAGVPLLPVFAVKEGERFLVSVRPPVESVEQFVEEYEKWISKYPEQWCGERTL